MPSPVEPSPGQRLGYLLKHAQLAFMDQSLQALGPLQINGRELAVLTVLSGLESLAQQQAAARLGLDRTTMVDLIDELERKHFVIRHPDPNDRRRNLVDLTVQGRHVLASGTLAAEEAERRFLAALDPAEQERFRSMLQRILARADDQA